VVGFAEQNYRRAESNAVSSGVDIAVDERNFFWGIRRKLDFVFMLK
jgi:hypothetical protein